MQSVVREGKYLMSTSVHTDKAPEAIGPYSQAIIEGSTIYVSGQIPLDPSTGELVEGDIQAQAKQCLTNISHILEAANSGMDKVLKVSVLLADIEDFASVNDVYAEFFSEPYPARAAYAVAALPKGARIEIEAIAYL